MLIPFGKYKGKNTDDVPASYLLWCLKQDGIEDQYEEFYDYLLTIESTLVLENNGTLNHD